MWQQLLSRLRVGPAKHLLKPRAARMKQVLALEAVLVAVAPWPPSNEDSRIRCSILGGWGEASLPARGESSLTAARHGERERHREHAPQRHRDTENFSGLLSASVTPWQYSSLPRSPPPCHFRPCRVSP